MKSHTAIMGLLAVVALAVGVLGATGCAGTKAAYNAADTLEERAYVVTEHYAAVVHQAADLKDKGVLKGARSRERRKRKAWRSPWCCRSVTSSRSTTRRRVPKRRWRCRALSTMPCARSLTWCES
jgi:hypothetical protein